MKINNVNKGRVVSIPLYYGYNLHLGAPDLLNEDALTSAGENFTMTEGQNTITLSETPPRNIVLYRNNATLDTTLWSWEIGTNTIEIDSSVNIAEGEIFSVIYT